MTTSKLFAYLKLFRIANVFTAFADIAMGFVFVSAHTTGIQIVPLLIACLASGLLYTSGMVLNDAFDAPIDAKDRSNRPIPTGEISRQWAFVLGGLMMACGVVAAAGFGAMVDESFFRSRALIIALCLAFSILLYDGILKRLPVAPIAMGSCRFFNVLLGMTAAAPFAEEKNLWLEFGAPELMVAGGIGLYIVGVTWFARTEAKRSNRGMLSSALVVMIGGMTLLALFPSVSSDSSRFSRHLIGFGPLLFGLVGVVVVRRCIDAIINPEPKQVQQAIRQSILSLIIFDASVCLAVAPNQPYYGMFVLALLGPMVFLGRWIPST